MQTVHAQCIAVVTVARVLWLVHCMWRAWFVERELLPGRTLCTQLHSVPKADV